MWKCQVAAGVLLGLSSAGAQRAVLPSTQRSQPVCMQHGAGSLMLSVRSSERKSAASNSQRLCSSRAAVSPHLVNLCFLTESPQLGSEPSPALHSSSMHTEHTELWLNLGVGHTSPASPGRDMGLLWCFNELQKGDSIWVKAGHNKEINFKSYSLMFAFQNEHKYPGEQQATWNKICKRAGTSLRVSQSQVTNVLTDTTVQLLMQLKRALSSASFHDKVAFHLTSS